MLSDLRLFKAGRFAVGAGLYGGILLCYFAFYSKNLCGLYKMKAFSGTALVLIYLFIHIMLFNAGFLLRGSLFTK
jgi:hypothetical protein